MCYFDDISVSFIVVKSMSYKIEACDTENHTSLDESSDLHCTSKVYFIIKLGNAICFFLIKWLILCLIYSSEFPM